MDTKELRPSRGIVLKHFSPRDVVSRWNVLEVHARATSLAAARFLDGLRDRMPFPVAALQVEGGSAFTAGFVHACQQQALPLFAILPRSPQLNGPRRPSAAHPTGIRQPLAISTKGDISKEL